MRRRTFTGHWVLCLACAGVAFFAWEKGVFQTVYANDMSMMTSVIAALFVGTTIWIGRMAWFTDGGRWEGPEWKHWHAMGLADDLKPAPIPDASYGHLAERLCVMAGLCGTAIGLSLQAKALSGGATSFVALATSLYTTASGVTAAALIAILTYNLEQGIQRARR